MKMHTVRWVPAALILVFLPACPLADWFKEWFGTTSPQATEDIQSKKESDIKQQASLYDDGPGVVLQDGKTVVSQEKFAEHVDAVLQSQPGIEQYLQMMGSDQVKAMYQQIAQVLRDQHVMRIFVEDQGLDQSDEYQKNRQMLIDQVENQLANHAFSQYLQNQIADVSDREARSFYQNQQNKEMFQREPFVEQSGGVKAVVVKTDSQKQADNIREMAEQSGDLKKAAREYDKSDAVQDLGVVSQQDTQPNRSVVAEINRMKDVPGLSTVKAEDGSVYVIRAIEKVDATYADFENVKQSVKDVIKSQRFQKEYETKLDQLRKQYDIRVDEDMINQFVQQNFGADNNNNDNAQ